MKKQGKPPNWCCGSKPNNLSFDSFVVPRVWPLRLRHALAVVVPII